MLVSCCLLLTFFNPSAYFPLFSLCAPPRLFLSPPAVCCCSTQSDVEWTFSSVLIRGVKLCCASEKLLSSPVNGKSEQSVVLASTHQSEQRLHGWHAAALRFKAHFLWMVHSLFLSITDASLCCEAAACDFHLNKIPTNKQDAFYIIGLETNSTQIAEIRWCSHVSGCRPFHGAAGEAQPWNGDTFHVLLHVRSDCLLKSSCFLMEISQKRIVQFEQFAAIGAPLDTFCTDLNVCLFFPLELDYDALICVFSLCCTTRWAYDIYIIHLREGCSWLINDQSSLWCYPSHEPRCLPPSHTLCK